MSELSLSERLRTAHVSRWQIVRTIRNQTLAEHSYLVYIWTKAFAEAMKLPAIDQNMAIHWALEHDVPEVKTGDLASPIKAAMREAVPHDDPIRRIELSISERYAVLYDAIKNEYPHVRVLVKLADIVEAVAFLEIEGIGPHAKDVQRNLWQEFRTKLDQAEKDFPQYDWEAAYIIARRETGG